MPGIAMSSGKNMKNSARRTPNRMASDSELPQDVLAAIRANRKIDAIKLLREQRGLGLKEAKHIVDAYVLKHPSEAFHEAPKAESGTGRLVLGVILLVMGYAAYRLYLSS